MKTSSLSSKIGFLVFVLSLVLIALVIPTPKPLHAKTNRASEIDICPASIPPDTPLDTDIEVYLPFILNRKTEDTAITEVTALVGPDGGQLSLSNGSKLTIPEGALPTTHTVSLSYIEEGPSLEEDAIVFYEFKPSGLHFSLPATFTLAYGDSPQLDTDNLNVVMFDETSGEWTRKSIVDRNEVRNTIDVEIDHFSWAVGYIEKSLYVVLEIPGVYLKPGDILVKMNSDCKHAFASWFTGHAAIFGALEPSIDDEKNKVYESNLYGDEKRHDCPMEGGVRTTRSLSKLIEDSCGFYMGARRNPSATDDQAKDARYYALLQANADKGYTPLNWSDNCYSCVGLVEHAYEEAGADIIADYKHGILTPFQLYNNTVPVDEIEVEVGQYIAIPVSAIVKWGDLPYQNVKSIVSIDGKPEGASFNEGTFEWTPNAEQDNEQYQLTFTARHPHVRVQATQVLTISVTHNDPTPTPIPDTISLEAFNWAQYFVQSHNLEAWLKRYVDTVEFKNAATFMVRPGLADASCVSLEAYAAPGYYVASAGPQNQPVVHDQLLLLPIEDDDSFRRNATFCPQPGLADNQDLSLEAYDRPGYYVRHSDFRVRLMQYEDTTIFKEDATFFVREPLADPDAVVGVTGVTITGPTSGAPETEYTFEASITPPNAAAPITYIWSPEPLSGQGTSRSTYSWSNGGNKTIGVSAMNSTGSASAEHTISVDEAPDEPTPISTIDDGRGDVSDPSWFEPWPDERGLVIEDNQASVSFPIQLIDAPIDFAWHAGVDMWSDEILDRVPDTGQTYWTFDVPSATSDTIDGALPGHFDVVRTEVKYLPSVDFLRFEWELRDTLPEPDVRGSYYYFVLNDYQWRVYLYGTEQGWNWEVDGDFGVPKMAFQDIVSATVTDLGAGAINFQMKMADDIPDGRYVPNGVGWPFFAWGLDTDNDSMTGQQPSGRDVILMIRLEGEIVEGYPEWAAYMRTWNGQYFEDQREIDFTRSGTGVSVVVEVADLGLSPFFRWDATSGTFIAPGSIVFPSGRDFFNNVDDAPDEGMIEAELPFDPTSDVKFR